jgi:hypothetical protein
MKDSSIIKLVAILAVTFVVAIGANGYFGLEKTEILEDKQTERVLAVEHEATSRVLQVEDKATERVEAIQEEKTHRTEERSKFWNKLVPWNNTDDPTFTREGE